MSWKTLPKKKETPPFQKQLRELEEKSRSLNRQKANLEARLSPAAIEAEKKAHPPVWRSSSEGESFIRDEEPLPSINRKQNRSLSVQRHRDRNLFIFLAAILVLILIWMSRSLLS